MLLMTARFTKPKKFSRDLHIRQNLKTNQRLKIQAQVILNQLPCGLLSIICMCVCYWEMCSLCPLSDCPDSCTVSFISSGWEDRKQGLARRDIRITTSQTLSQNRTPTCCLLWIQLSHFRPQNHSENSCALPWKDRLGDCVLGSRESERKWVLPRWEGW